MFSLDVGLTAHEDIVPNEFPSTDWPVLGWGRHRGYHGRGPIHGLGPFQAIATRDRGHDVYYLTVCCPGFAFADPPGGRHDIFRISTNRALIVKLRETMSLLGPSSIPRTWAAQHVCRVSGRLGQQEAVR